MGLYCSHGAWHGAYSRFNRFRQYLARTVGGSFPPHEPDFVEDDGSPPNPNDWYWDDEVVPEHETGFRLLLDHSDCDGELSPGECVLVAAWLRWAIPHLPEEVNGDKPQEWALIFAEGCEAAAAAGEALVFG